MANNPNSFDNVVPFHCTHDIPFWIDIIFGNMAFFYEKRRISSNYQSTGHRTTQIYQIIHPSLFMPCQKFVFWQGNRFIIYFNDLFLSLFLVWGLSKWNTLCDWLVHQTLPTLATLREHTKQSQHGRSLLLSWRKALSVKGGAGRPDSAWQSLAPRGPLKFDYIRSVNLNVSGVCSSQIPSLIWFNSLILT